MRVIAGSRKSLKLKTLEGNNTRPTNDRIKETLFNMLGNDVNFCRFLDLFAGSGQIGIEALSRGAESAVFVENNRGCVDIIKDNLKFTRFTEESKVIFKDVFTALAGNMVGNGFHIIFMDPPYAQHREDEALKSIRENKILAEDGFVIIEADLERDFSFAENLGFKIIKEKIYKTNKHVFLEEV